MKGISKGLFLASLFFINGCNSTQDNQDIYVKEVNGPAGGFAGATEFVPEMFADGQTIYTYDEKNALWRGVVFLPNQEMRYESLEGLKIGSTYTIVDGKMYVTDNKKSPTITLESAGKTEWKVRGEDNDHVTWQDTWYLELKFKEEMLEGKCYFSCYNNGDKCINEKVCFNNELLKTYTLEGSLKHAYPYRLEYNGIVVKRETDEYRLYLIDISAQNELNVWYVSESENYANNSMWTPILF